MRYFIIAQHLEDGGTRLESPAADTYKERFHELVTEAIADPTCGVARIDLISSSQGVIKSKKIKPVQAPAAAETAPLASEQSASETPAAAASAKPASGLLARLPVAKK